MQGPLGQDIQQSLLLLRLGLLYLSKFVRLQAIRRSYSYNDLSFPLDT